jgi:hypothetical protein
MPHRAVPLASLPLAALLLATTAPHASAQGCVPDSVGAFGVVTCTGADTDGFDDGSDNITVTVEVGASVVTTDSDAIQVNGDFVTVVNNGTVEAREAYAEDAAGDAISGDEGVQAGNDATIRNSGTIAGGKTGVRADANAQVINETGATISSANEAIDLDDDGFVANDGLISGGSRGIDAGDALIVENGLNGRIESDDEGIEAGDDVEIVNEGEIVAVDKGIDVGDGLVLSNFGLIDSDDEGVEAEDQADIVNDGRIEGVDDAVQVGELAVIDNQGQIVSSGGDGIDLDSGVVFNEGLIETMDAGGAGIDFDASILPPDPVAGGSIILNAGTIRGGTGILVETGEGGDPANTSSQAVFNEGLIEGTQGIAANLGAGEDLFALIDGGTVIGDVLLGGGDDLLLILGTPGAFDPLTLFDGGADVDVALFDGYLSSDATILDVTGEIVRLSLALPGGPGSLIMMPGLPAGGLSPTASFDLQLARFEIFDFDDGLFELDAGGTGFVALAPIPLPAAGWMLLGAVAGLGALRARRG